MLRYRTENGPITSPMGLLSLSTSTISQVHSTYLPAKLTRDDSSRHSSSSVIREKKERQIKEMRKEAEREEEQHLIMQIVVQSFVSERAHKCEGDNANSRRRISGTISSNQSGKSFSNLGTTSDAESYFVY